MTQKIKENSISHRKVNCCGIHDIVAVFIVLNGLYIDH